MSKPAIFKNALSEYTAGNLQQAHRLCCQILDQEGGYIPANQLLPIILFKLGKSDEAIALMQKVVDRWPDLAGSHYSLSMMQLWCGDFVRGWQEYEWRIGVESFNIPQANIP